MDAKATAWRYLRAQREAVLWKVEGLGERDQRMPLTPTGTNLLGLVKHLAGCEAEYFGVCLGRPWPEPMAFWADDAEPNADMWATEDESPAEVIDLYRRVIAFADETIEPLALDAPASVPWWGTPETDLHTLLVHMAVETARHAGPPRHPARAARRRPRAARRPSPTSPTSTPRGGTPTSPGCAASQRPRPAAEAAGPVGRRRQPAERPTPMARSGPRTCRVG